jgi:hypothetical protein
VVRTGATDAAQRRAGREVPVEQLADLPWQLPLGSLPPMPDARVEDAAADAAAE